MIARPAAHRYWEKPARAEPRGLRIILTGMACLVLSGCGRQPEQDAPSPGPVVERVEKMERPAAPRFRSNTSPLRQRLAVGSQQGAESHFGPATVTCQTQAVTNS